jgi:hypothetical protein
MNYQARFEDEGFVYQLKVRPADEKRSNLYTDSQGAGYYCRWTIEEKNRRFSNEVTVTDDACEVIVYSSVEAAVRGAKDFLSI